MSGGKGRREKGDRIEREIVARHIAAGIHAERVPLSGQTHYQGRNADVDVYPWGKDAAPLVAEVKARAGGDGFVMLARWLGDADLLFLRQDRAEPLVTMPWRVWERLLRGGRDV